MSEAVSALAGARASGAVDVAEAGLQGMVTIRGDLADKAFQKAVGEIGGAHLPERRRLSSGEGGSLLWMSPDELMLLCPHGEAEARVAALSAALSGVHHLAVNVSDARAVFTVTGEDSRVRETLAKLSPADLRPASLPVGEVRRTRLAQVPAAFWFEAEGRARVVCFRSVAQYVFDLLRTAGAKGAEVGHF